MKSPSRKTLGFIGALIAGILTAFQKQFGISLDPVAVGAGITAVLTYIFFEAKLDLTALTKQPSKWRDPKFWITVVSAVLAAVEATFNVGMPVEFIVGSLTTFVGILFGAKFKKSRPY